MSSLYVLYSSKLSLLYYDDVSQSKKLNDKNAAFNWKTNGEQNVTISQTEWGNFNY